MFRKATAEDFDYVLAHLRQEDRIEMAASTGVASDGYTVALTLYEGDFPICIFGATREGNVATMFRIATDHWPDVIGQAIRFGRRVMLPKLKECGIERVEAHTRDRPDDTAWLRLFGAQKYAEFDRNGEKFASFAVDLA